MQIADEQLDDVRALVERQRAIPALIVRSIVARLDSAEAAACPRCNGPKIDLADASWAADVQG